MDQGRYTAVIAIELKGTIGRREEDFNRIFQHFKHTDQKKPAQKAGFLLLKYYLL
jgi:hypothetical protein